MTSAIHITLSFDDNFWAPAYAVMRSICLSTKRRTDLVFHLLHMPITEEHRRDLMEITHEFGAQLHWYALDQSELFENFVSGLPANTRWPRLVYARLLLSDLLPSEVNRVIYLDCDMMVRWPIEQLFDIDLLDRPLGAVRDSQAPFLVGRRDMRHNADIFDPADPYFNSGMLLIALDKWREIDVKAQVGFLAEKGWLSRIYFDQDLLNIVFRGRWHPVEWRWNTIDAHPAHEALDPAILHYTLAHKPWATLGGILRSSAYARGYRHVMTNELFYRFARHRWKRWWRRRLGMRG